MDKHKWYFVPAIAVLALVAGLYLSGYLTLWLLKDETMGLRQIVVVTAVAAGMAGCEPPQETVAAEQTQITVPVVKQVASVTSKIHAEPMVAAVSERATTDAASPVPDEIRAFVPRDSTLLAYKRFDLTGDGNEDAVLIVRHPITEKYPEFSRNPCDLIVLHGEAGGFKIAAKSNKIVDCTYKLYARKIASKPDELNDMLELKPNEITSDEETDRPTGVSTTYSFKYSSKAKGWYLSYARAAFARSERIGQEDVESESDEWELNVYVQVARYPKDIPLISLSKFDPDEELLLRAMKRNQKAIE